MDDKSTTPQSTSIDPNLTYEETPVITPITATIEENTQPTPPLYAPKKKSFLSFIKGFLIFIFLFILGYALSGVIRNIINTQSQEKITSPNIAPTPGLVNLEIPESTQTAFMGTKTTTSSGTPIWKQFTPISGSTRKPIDTIQFKLPDSVLPPVCDGSACGSQGTYLPGGTRLTIAPRGVGEVLADFRGKIISDAGGKPFVIKQKTIAGKQATEFSTANVGSTVGGYAFSTMRGYMIEITDALSLEINHFAPSGITADFAADDALFETIVATLVFSETNTKGSVIPPTPTMAISTTPNPLTPIR